MFDNVGNDIRTGAITITGLNDLGKRLAAFTDKIANQITRTALNDGAKVFKAKAIDNIELNNHNIKQHNLKVKGVYIKIDPGNLMKNIKIKTNTNVPKGTYRVEVYLKKDHAYYGLWVERGASHMAATPFMAAAYETEKETVAETFKETIRRAISQGGINVR